MALPIFTSSSPSGPAAILCLQRQSADEAATTWSEFSSRDEAIAGSLCSVISSSLDAYEVRDRLSEVRKQLDEANITEEKMTAIIAWLLEIQAADPHNAHSKELQSMRRAFVHAQFGEKTDPLSPKGGTLREISRPVVERSYGQNPMGSRPRSSIGDALSAFDMADTNGDGVLSREEFDAWLDRRR